MTHKFIHLQLQVTYSATQQQEPTSSIKTHNGLPYSTTQREAEQR